MSPVVSVPCSGRYPQLESMNESTNVSVNIAQGNPRDFFHTCPEVLGFGMKTEGTQGDTFLRWIIS